MSIWEAWPKGYDSTNTDALHELDATVPRQRLAAYENLRAVFIKLRSQVGRVDYPDGEFAYRVIGEPDFIEAGADEALAALDRLDREKP